jgi:hypothetical protein
MNMNKIKIAGPIIALLAMVACVDVTVAEPSVCDTVTFGTIPAAPISIQVPPISLSTPLDISEPLSKISDVFDQLTLNGADLTITSSSDLSWVSSLEISVDGGNPNLPKATMASYHSTGAGPGKSLSMHMDMEPNTILTYMKSPLTVTLTVSGFSPTEANDLGGNVCLSVAGGLKKSL